MIGQIIDIDYSKATVYTQMNRTSSLAQSTIQIQELLKTFQRNSKDDLFLRYSLEEMIIKTSMEKNTVIRKTMKNFVFSNFKVLFI